MTPLKQRERFYRAILSNTKHDIELRALPSKHRIFTRDQGAIEQFISQHITDNLYHGVYTREGGGSKDHVREVPCFFADLDFKNYENGEEEARSRLKAFEPYPSFVVYSGNGFHAYWFLDRIIEPSQKVEAILRGIAKHLRGDASAAELARILRIPGTVNYKNDPKKPVGLIHASDLIYPPELFDRYEEKAIIPDARNNGSKELSEHIETIRAKCTFLKYCYDKRASLPEPLWFLMVSNLSRYPVNPYDLVHAFSLEHPGYSPRETEQKIKHGINDTQPHTCAYIKETMKDLTGSDCGKDCRVTAPIVLLTRTRTAMKTSQASMILTRLNDLFNEPEDNVTWQVEGILPTGGFSVLASKPKTGKSTLARNLALCTAQGELFLSRGVQKGPVIYYALEEKRSEVRRHFQDMGATGEEEIHIYSGSAPIDAIMQIREATEQIRPVLIIIDPLFRLARVRDGNDYAAVTQALEPLLILARETGAHVLCVHHTGKGDRQGGDSVLGSTAIFSTADTLLLMKRYEYYRTIHSIQRYGEDVEETTLHYNTEDRTIQLGDSK
jgi:hypothetical protein